MQQLQAAGLTLMAQRMAPPPLGPLELQAVALWNFSGGHRPQCWPVFDALHTVHDWDQLAELQDAIRAGMNQREAAERRAGARHG